MNQNTHDLHHLAGAYALDALDAEERRAFEAHYPTCEICKDEVGDFRAIGAVLAEGVETAPRPELKTQINAVVTPLEGETGSIRIVWSDELDQVAIFGNDLPAPGDGKAYALWFVEADGVTPATLFGTDGDMVRFVDDVEDIDPTAWGITIEPAEGSPQPTGEILYQGAL